RGEPRLSLLAERRAAVAGGAEGNVVPGPAAIEERSDVQGALPGVQRGRGREAGARQVSLRGEAGAAVGPTCRSTVAGVPVVRAPCFGRPSATAVAACPAGFGA